MACSASALPRPVLPRRQGLTGRQRRNLIAGHAMLIFLAGLQGIPPELIDAATVDGATPWRKLRHVKIPLFTPTIFFVLNTSFIGAFQAFDQFMIMTQGGPAFATTPLVLYIYQKGFNQFYMGYATSMATVLFLCILAFTQYQEWAALWTKYMDPIFVEGKDNIAEALAGLNKETNELFAA